MKRRTVIGATIAAALVLYAAVSLWPYDWHGARLMMNGAEVLPDGGVRFQKPGIALAKEAPAWVEAAMRSHWVELSLQFRPFVPEQFGPARIFTLSDGPFRRNLTIGQDGADLILRLRTAWTSPNGTIDSKPVARVPRVFLTNDWVDLRILVEPGRLRMMVGGERLVDEALPPRPLETWGPSHRLALGNEVTYNRPWLGEVRRATVRVGGSTENYAETNELEFPPAFLFTKNFPKLVPLRELNPRDAVENVVLYLPLGLLLGFLIALNGKQRNWSITLGALLLVAAVSASMEVLQVFVPLRAPSVDDLIFNTLGGGLGLLLALRARRRLGPAARP